MRAIKAFFILICAPALVLEQIEKSRKPEPVYRELYSTWDANNCTLTWESKAALDGESDAPVVRYRIVFHKASMEIVAGATREKRVFTAEEAEKVHQLLHQVMSLYTVQSTVWWKNGEGKKVDPDAELPDVLKKHGPPFSIRDENDEPLHLPLPGKDHSSAILRAQVRE